MTDEQMIVGSFKCCWCYVLPGTTKIVHVGGVAANKVGSVPTSHYGDHRRIMIPLPSQAFHIGVRVAVNKVGRFFVPGAMEIVV